jgi:hypothetical protein
VPEQNSSSVFAVLCDSSSPQRPPAFYSHSRRFESGAWRVFFTTMGEASKALAAFIDNIPASKLKGIRHDEGTIYCDKNFRLDMQSVRRP